MAIYRAVHVNFWDDSKVLDEMEIEDKFFMLYLLTNPHSNQIGCFEISKRQMMNETGFDKKQIEDLLKKFENELHLIIYSTKTKEIFVKNWYKYNWNKSPKVRICIEKEFLKIKNNDLKEKLYKMLIEMYGKDTLSIQYANGMYSLCIDVCIKEKEKEKEKEEKKEKQKQKEEEKEKEAKLPQTPTTTDIFNFSLTLFEGYDEKDLKKCSKKFFEYYKEIGWEKIDWKKRAKKWFEDDIKYGNLKKEETLDDRVKEIFGDS